MRSRLFMSVLVVALGCLFVAVSAQAGTITVTTSSLGWQFISQNTYGLPANLTSIGCGSENETSCEPTGVFNFNVAFAPGTDATYQILDPLGEITPTPGPGISDTIHVFNDSTTGLGVLTFESDPTTQTTIPGAIVLGTETLCPNPTTFSNVCPTPGGTNNQGGFIGTIHVTDVFGDVITAQVASDSQVVFDPFGLGADSSDEVKFSGNVTTLPTVPEPPTWLLLASGLLGLVAAKKWRLICNNT